MSKARDIADLDFNAPDIDGGNIDGAVIGGTTPAAGSFSGLTVDGAVAINSNNIVQTSLTPSYNFIESDITDENTQLLSAGGTFRIRTVDDSGSNVAERLRIDHGTGDISFYNSDGSAAKMVWDSSAESLGIGQSAPIAKIDILGANYVVTNSGQARGGIHIKPASGVGAGEFGGAISFSTGGSGSSAIAAVNTGGADTDSNGLAFFTHPSGTGSADAVEKMRITEVGSVLAGTTNSGLSSSSSSTGINLIPNGASAFVRDGGAVLYLNRVTSDGSIVQFRKDGTTVGSIGTASGDLNINGPAGHSGIRFQASSILPRYNGSDTDGTTDLGYDDGTDTHRWRNLYLSGGVVFGPASASNVSSQTLDSYEEGTWTPVLTSAGTASNQVTSHAGGSYTKVGRLVTAVIRWRTSNNGNDQGQFGITLPFVVGNTLSTTGLEGAASLANVAGVTVAHSDLSASPIEGQNQIWFYYKVNSTSTSVTPLLCHQTANTFDGRVTVTYMT